MNKKQQNKLNIILAIQEAAILYKNNLVGRKFLYIFENNYIEVVYTKKNFKHLTGVKSYLSADNFFKTALKRQLRVSDIYFTSDHPYQLCIRKIRHLKNITGISTAEGFFLKDISTVTKSFKFGATQLDFTLCFNQRTNSIGIPLGNSFHVESLRDEDCFDRSGSVYEITHILSKKNDQSTYDTLHFMDSRYSIDEVPEELKSIILLN